MLSNDVSIPECTDMKLEEVIQGDIIEGTVIIKQNLFQRSHLFC